MKMTSAALFIMVILLGSSAWSDEVPALAPPFPTRAPQGLGDRVDPAYDDQASEPAHLPNKDGRDGARVQFYYDPLSSYSKLVTNVGASPTQFGYSSTSGNMGGIQMMWSVWAPSDFEFQTGIDYVFPVDVQGQQNTVGTYVVNGQTLNVVGFKILQAGYRFNFGDFTLAPFGGFGIYYGKNSLTLANALSGGQTNLINYTKLMAVYTAGARLDYNLNSSRTLALGIGCEFFVPTKITDQLSQSGSVTSELPGSEQYLQSNMDFLTGVGARLFVGVAGYL